MTKNDRTKEITAPAPHNPIAQNHLIFRPGEGEATGGKEGHWFSLYACMQFWTRQPSPHTQMQN